jgi:hypothetical protein
MRWPFGDCATTTATPLSSTTDGDAYDTYVNANATKDQLVIVGANDPEAAEPVALARVVADETPHRVFEVAADRRLAVREDRRDRSATSGL